MNLVSPNEAEIDGSGNLILDEGAFFTGTLVGQEVQLARGSEILVYSATDCHILLPIDGSANVHVFSPYLVRDSVLSILEIPTVANISLLTSGCGDLSIRDSIIELHDASNTIIGSEHRILDMICYDECQSLDTNILVPPPPVDGKAFELRWGRMGCMC